MNTKPLTVAVVGATGVVGGTMIRMLLEREFPVGELRLLASARSRPARSVDVDGTEHIVREATPDAFDGVDIALFSAGGDTSKALAPEAARRGATVIDNSIAWRMDPAVPLVVSQVNPDDLERHEGIIANPNCSTMQLVPVLMALRDAVGLERVVVDTYQAVSGTGGKAITELQAQVEAHVGGQPLEATVYPHQIAFNALPQVDVFLDNGYTKEEWKVVTESRKILHLPDLRISSTAVRIPVFVAHSEAVHVETPRADHAGPGPDAVRRRPGRRRPGRPVDLDLSARHRGRRLATRSTSGASARTRRIDGGRGLAFWVVSDNLRKGAATNAVQLAEILVERGLGQGRRGTGRGRNARRDRRRAPGGARGDRGGGPRLHALPPPRDPHEGRPGRGRPVDTEVVFVGEGPGQNEDREGRPFVGRAGGLLVSLLGHIGWTPRGRVHHQHREVPAARQPRPGAGRDRRLRAVPAAPARGARPGRRRDPRPPLDGPRSCRAPGSRRPTARPASPTRRPAPAMRRSSRCTTRPPRCARRRSSARATRTSRCIPGVLTDARERRRAAADARPPTQRATPPGPAAAATDPRAVDRRRPRCDRRADAADQLTLF